MNVYDFDGTILHGDSEDYFREYITKNYKIKFKHKLELKFFDLLFKLKIIKDQCYRNHCYPYISYIGDLSKISKDFWDVYEKEIYSHYYKLHKGDDVVVSATPRVILEEIMKRLGVKTLICTEMDIKTGKVGKLCRAEEKVVRYNKVFNESPIEDYYFDKDHDMFLMKYAKRGHRVLGDNKFKEEK